MYQIAVCDDDKIFCQQFRQNLDTVVKELDMQCNISIWYTAESLQKHLTDGNKIDLIFLDIEFLELDGVSLGRFIRENLLNYRMQLIYISHEQGHAMKLFETEPMDFLVKPIDASHIQKVLQRFLKQQSYTSESFTFKEERGNAQLPYDSIWYFQSMNHKIIIHTKDEQREFYGKLSDVEKMVPNHFIRIHKSYLVNEFFISRFHYDKVILRNQQTLTISKPYRNAVQNKVRQAINEH